MGLNARTLVVAAIVPERHPTEMKRDVCLLRTPTYLEIVDRITNAPRKGWVATSNKSQHQHINSINKRNTRPAALVLVCNKV